MFYWDQPYVTPHAQHRCNSAKALTAVRVGDFLKFPMEKMKIFEENWNWWVKITIFNGKIHYFYGHFQ